MSNIRLLTIISALFYVAIGISSPLITLYLQSLGASYAQISLILSSVVVVSFFANYFWGWFSDRVGRRKPLLTIGLAILATSFFLLSRAPNGNWAWAARIFEGLGGAAYGTLSLAMMGDLLDRERQKGRKMGVFRGLGSMSFAIGAVIGGWVADHNSIAQALLVCSGLYLTAAVCTYLIEEVKVAPQPRPVGLSPRTAPLPTLLSKINALPLFFLAGVILWTAAHSASASMWPNYMKELGYSKTASSSLWGLAALIEFPAMVLAGRLSDRVGRAPLLSAGGLFITVTNLGYLFLAKVFPLLLGVQVFRGFGFGSYTTTAMTFATENSEQRTRGSKSGIFTTATSAGSVLGSSIGGTLVQLGSSLGGASAPLYGFQFLYGTVAALALCSAGCFWLLKRQTKAMLAPGITPL